MAKYNREVIIKQISPFISVRAKFFVYLSIITYFFLFYTLIFQNTLYQIIFTLYFIKISISLIFFNSFSFFTYNNYHLLSIYMITVVNLLRYIKETTKHHLYTKYMGWYWLKHWRLSHWLPPGTILWFLWSTLFFLTNLKNSSKVLDWMSSDSTDNFLLHQ